MSRDISSDILPVPIRSRIRRAKKIEVVQPHLRRDAPDRPVVDSLAPAGGMETEATRHRSRSAQSIDDGLVGVCVHGDD